jgi:hypothetical protein
VVDDHVVVSVLVLLMGSQSVTTAATDTIDEEPYPTYSSLGSERPEDNTIVFDFISPFTKVYHPLENEEQFQIIPTTAEII